MDVSCVPERFHNLIFSQFFLMIVQIAADEKQEKKKDQKNLQSFAWFLTLDSVLRRLCDLYNFSLFVSQ